MNIIRESAKKLYAEPNTGLGGISRVYDDYIVADVNSWYKTKQKLKEVEQKLLCALFDGKIQFLPKPNSKFVDHGVLKVVRDALVDEICDTIVSLSTVGLIGTKAKELSYVVEKSKVPNIWGVIGDFSAQDKVRKVENELWADRNLKSKKVRTPEIARAYFNFVEKRKNKYFYEPNTEVPLAKALVLIDSLYDITPLQLFEYFRRSQANVAYATMIMAPELSNLNESIQPQLEITWVTDRNNVYMRHCRGKSLGYVHKLKNILDWNFNSFFQFDNKALVVESIKQYSTYSLLQITCIDACSWHSIRTLPLSTFYKPIFDVKRFVRHHRMKVYFVDGFKLIKMIDYIARLVIEKTEPATILTYVSAMRHRLIVGNFEVETDFQVDEKTLKQTIRFAIFYAILKKTDVYNTVGMAVKIAKNHDGKYKHILIQRFQEIWDWVKGVDRRVLITKMDEIMYATPEYLIEKVDVKPWDPLNIKGSVSNDEPRGYAFYNTTQEEFEDVEHERLWQLSKKLIEQKKEIDKKKAKLKVKPPDPVALPAIEAKSVIEDHGWKVPYLTKMNSEYEHFVAVVSNQWDSCQKIFNLPVKKNRGFLKARELHRAYFEDAKAIFEIGNFPGFSTSYFRGQGLKTIAVSPSEMTNSKNPGSWACRAKVQIYQKFEDLDMEFVEGLITEPIWFSDASIEAGRSIPNRQLCELIMRNWADSSSKKLVIKVFEIEPFIKFISNFSVGFYKPKASKQNEEIYIILSKEEILMEDQISEIEDECAYLKKRTLAIGCEHFYAELAKVTGKTKADLFNEPKLEGHSGKPDLTKEWLEKFQVPQNATIIDIGGGASNKLEGFPNYLNIDPLCTGKLMDYGPKKCDIMILSQSFHHLTPEEQEIVFEMSNSVDKVFVREHDVINSCQAFSLDMLHERYGESEKHYYIPFQKLLDKFEDVGLYPALVANRGFWTKQTVFSKAGGDIQFTLPQQDCERYLRNSASHYFTSATGSAYNNYQEMHKKISDKIQVLRNFPDYSKIKVTIMSRVAGGGKTTLILDKIKPRTGHYYVCNSNELLAKFRQDYDVKYGVKENCPGKTFEAMMLVDPKFVKAISLDEAFTFPITYIISLFTFFPRAVFKLYGDPKQLQSKDGEGYIPPALQLDKHLEYFKNVNQSNETFRFGDSLCKYLREYEDYEIFSKTGAPFTVKFPKFGEEPDGYSITFSENTRTNYLKTAGINSVTVRAAQGQDHSVVNLYLSQWDYFAVHNKALRRVALTRARDCLNIIEVDEYGMRTKLFPHIHKIQTYAEVATQLIPVIPNFHKIKSDKVVISELKPHTKFDVQALVNTFTLRLPENLQASATVTTEANPKGFRINTLVYYQKSDKESQRLTRTNFGKQFFVTSKHQTLMTAVERLAKSAANGNMKLTTDAILSNDRLIKNIKHVFLKDKIKFEADKFLSNFHYNIQEITRLKFNFSSNLGNMEENTWSAFEFVKQQIKVLGSLERVETNKLGQSIKAWSQEANVAFGALFRSLKQLLISSLKDKFIYANNISESELAKRISKLGQFDTTKDLDAEFMDGCHNARTVHAEQGFWLVVMGGNIENAIKYYGQMRLGLKVISSVATYTKGSELDSGSVATIDANIMLAIFVCMKLFDMEKCLGGPFKGDDVSLLWNNPAPSLDVSKLEGFTNMKLKEESNKYVYFCNSFYDAGYNFYDLRILIKKILQREYIKFNEKKDEENFKEYQTSIKLLLTPYLEHSQVRDLYAGYTNQSIDIVCLQIDLLNAFTEISWSQLKKELNKEIIFQV